VAAGSVAEFHYRIPGRPVGLRPGAHPSRAEGVFGAYIGLRPLLSRPDPRRIDLRRSVADPMGQWLVRTMSERVSVPVYVIADVSASMGCDGSDGKRKAACDLLESAAWSAWRTGDPFGFVAADERVREELAWPATFARGTGPRLAALLRAMPLAGVNARGLLQAARYLGGRRALVFLVSDFHFDLDFARQVLAALAAHFVVPVVIWGVAETAHPATSGWIKVADSEARARRHLWLRPSFADRLDAAVRHRRAELRALFRGLGIRPVFLDDGFRADRMTDFFLGHASDVAQVD
jgi:uncharacterized protein (DUF58 family)